MFEGDICRCINRLTYQKSSATLSWQSIERSLAPLDRLTAKVFVVGLQPIEGIELGRGVEPTANEQLKNRGALISAEVFVTKFSHRLKLRLFAYFFPVEAKGPPSEVP